MVTAMDAAVGEVVAALRARNMYDNTLIAWFSDNVRWQCFLDSSRRPSRYEQF